jgi:hypothetical protein
MFTPKLCVGHNRRCANRPSHIVEQPPQLIEHNEIDDWTEEIQMEQASDLPIFINPTEEEKGSNFNADNGGKEIEPSKNDFFGDSRAETCPKPFRNNVPWFAGTPLFAKNCENESDRHSPKVKWITGENTRPKFVENEELPETERDGGRAELRDEEEEGHREKDCSQDPRIQTSGFLAFVID